MKHNGKCLEAFGDAAELLPGADLSVVSGHCTAVVQEEQIKFPC